MRVFITIICCFFIMYGTAVAESGKRCTLKEGSNIIRVNWAEGGISHLMAKEDLLVDVGQEIDPKLAKEINSLSSFNMYDWNGAYMATFDFTLTLIVRDENLKDCGDIPEPEWMKEDDDILYNDHSDEVSRCEEECAEYKGDPDFDACVGGCLMFSW